MKGRVDRDVADEAARQAWGARELLLRLGFAPTQVTVQVGVPFGAEQDKPVAERQLHAFVLLQVADASSTDGARLFQIDCGVIPAAKLFGEVFRQRMQAIAGGVHTESSLQRAYEVTNAYQAREEIRALLIRRGFVFSEPGETGLDGGAN